MKKILNFIILGEICFLLLHTICVPLYILSEIYKYRFLMNKKLGILGGVNNFYRTEENPYFTCQLNGFTSVCFSVYTPCDARQWI